MLTHDEVRHIAQLARINLSDQDVERFAKDLSGVLDFFADLQEVDTENVKETSQVTGLENVLRPDIIEVHGTEDDLLKCTPHTIDNHCVRIPKIM